MNLLVLYCTHQTTPLAVRERLAFATPEKITASYIELRKRFPDFEAVVLSTCNRVEIYLAGQRDGVSITPSQVAHFLCGLQQPRKDLSW